MSDKLYCPTCGCPVRIGGEGVTKYYVPILKEKANKLCEAAKWFEGPPAFNPNAIVGYDETGHPINAEGAARMILRKAIADYEGEE